MTATFAAKYDLGEIVEMKQEGSFFIGRIITVAFSIGCPPGYAVRRPDGVVVHMLESELCIKGVDDVQTCQED